jgi:hypothetical protein
MRWLLGCEVDEGLPCSAGCGGGLFAAFNLDRQLLQLSREQEQYVRANAGDKGQL